MKLIPWLVALAVASILHASAAGAEPLSFGSQIILETLWTPAELQGNAADRQIRRLRVPDRAPPLRPQPLSTLPPLPVDWRGSIRWIKPRGDDKLIALTFDLCERADEVTGYDAAIVDGLRRQRVKATFFAGGEWMRAHAERTMQLMADPLFELADHGWTHGNFAVLDKDQVRRQVLWTQAEYELLWEKLQERALSAHVPPEEMHQIPRQPLLVRPPYGRCRPQALRELAELGLPAIQWNIVGADPVKTQTAANLTQSVTRQAQPGSIVVLHGNGRGYHTAEALPAIIAALRARGYQFVTVSELLRSGTPVVAEDCYEEKPGDNAHYDRLFGDGTGESTTPALKAGACSCKKADASLTLP